MRPCGPVWWVTSVMPSMSLARWRTSSTELGDLHAAALAAAAGMDLRLDHPDRPAQRAGGLLGLLGRVGDLAAQHGDAVLLEQRLRLIFVDVHGVRASQSLTASHSDFTDGHRLVEHGLLVGVQLDLDDLLDAAFADDHRHADIEILDAVLAGQVRGAGQQAALVLEVALGHLDRRGGRGVEGRAGLEQADDLGAAVARALDDRVQPLLGGPAHLDQIGQRDAGHGRVAHQRHHACRRGRPARRRSRPRPRP